MMHRKIFRPGKGQVPQRFTAAFVSGTVYGGDVVIWDSTAPSSQGPSGDGVLEGETLGDHDFVYVAPSASQEIAGGAGIVVGKTVNQDTVNAITDDELAIIQTWGVCRNINCEDNTVAADALLTLSTVANQCVDVSASTDTENIVIARVLSAADYTYTRGTATVYGVTGFVRCDW